MFKTGEKPPIGTYACKKCRTSVKIDHKKTTLPQCPNCQNTEFNKV